MDLNNLNDKSPVHSAVMVLHDLSIDSLILTKRSENLRNHPGEICFPGGLKEKEDKDLYSTALRELNEELGIPAERVTLVRELEPEQTLLGTIIHPWFATIQSIYPYYLNIGEVSSLICINMSLVTRKENYKELNIEKNGHKFKSCHFIYHEEYVWGATARIMQQLIKLE